MTTKHQFIFLLSLVFLSSCYYDNSEELYQNLPTETCDVSAVSYSIDVSDIIAKNCATSGCHLNPGAAANLDLSTYEAVSGAKTSIKNRINLPTGSAGKMPAGSSLSACDLEKLNTWLDQGAQNN